MRFCVYYQVVKISFIFLRLYFEKSQKNEKIRKISKFLCSISLYAPDEGPLLVNCPPQTKGSVKGNWIPKQETQRKLEKRFKTF